MHYIHTVALTYCTPVGHGRNPTVPCAPREPLSKAALSCPPPANGQSQRQGAATPLTLQGTHRHESEPGHQQVGRALTPAPFQLPNLLPLTASSLSKLLASWPTGGHLLSRHSGQLSPPLGTGHSVRGSPALWPSLVHWCSLEGLDLWSRAGRPTWAL